MSKNNKYRFFYRLAFFVSAFFVAYAIRNHEVWFTMTLPFLVTSFVKAIDVI